MPHQRVFAAERPMAILLLALERPGALDLPTDVPNLGVLPSMLVGRKVLLELFIPFEAFCADAAIKGSGHEWRLFWSPVVRRRARWLRR